jgi:hypothetical protein
MKFFTSLVLALVFTASLASAQERYGDAVVEQGELTIVRQGNSLKFARASQPVPVLVQDVLRVGDNSRVVLKSTREKSTIAMGANAVFQVKPFQFQEKQGFARMLFGRFRSVVTGLVGTETVNAKTATAVIGVKGTENVTSVRPRGDTMLLGVENITSIQNAARGPAAAVGFQEYPPSRGGYGGFVMARDDGGSPDFILIPTDMEPVQPQLVQDSGETPVGPDFLGLTIGDNPVISGPAPDEVIQALTTTLNSPPPADPGASQFPGQEGLTRAGLVTQEQLDEGEKAKVEAPPVEAGAPPPVAPQQQQQASEVQTQNLDDPAQNLFRGNVEIDFE